MHFDVATKTFKEENSEVNKIAFAAADKNLNWVELKNLSDKICETIKSTTISKGNTVLIYGDKEVFFLAAILSCYRMGLPFIPINNSLPKNRIEKIIDQTQSQVMIVCGNYENVPDVSLIINDDFSITKKSTVNFVNKIEAAYILFTSGSSGEPKGVIISDENIIYFSKWFVDNFSVNKETVFINQASFLFDISLADFFGTLQTGGTCILNTKEITSNTSLFFERINRYKGSYWNSTPAFISRCFADKNFNTENMPSIECFVLSGENLSSSLVKELKSRFPKAIIINAYGPTETTIFASFTEITEELLLENSLPICKTDNSTIYLENEEIIITGNNVGIGYLNNEKLTEEKFISYKNKKAFCTGDLAFIKNGYIYYNGRKDEQVKFNGYRIELNEIKHALECIDFVKQAECIPIIIDDKIKRLIAFIKSDKEFDIISIKKTLEKELPIYMIPSEIILVKEFPYTNSFKIDKQKLLNDYLNNN